MDKKQIIKDVAYLLAAAVIGATATYLVDTYKFAKLAKFLNDQGCVSIGAPANPVVAQYISEGFQCGGALVVLPRR